MFALLRLLMTGLLSIINVYASQLKLIFRRRSALRYYSSVNSALSSITQSEDETSTLEDTVAADNGFFLNAKSYPTDFRGINELYCGGDDVCEPVDTGFLFSINERPDEDEMKRLMLILAKRGWNLGCQNGYNIYLNQLNIIELLNDLFEESLDAKLVLYFFKWSECCSGSKHTIRTICRMIHILVSGNLNHRAVDLILHLVRNHGDEESCNSLLEVLYETHSEIRVLETTFSTLVNGYIQEGMVNMALKIACQMKHLNIFPSKGVCNSLLQALLGSKQLELAWDFLEVMRTRGMGLNAAMMSLFINKYCSEGDLESGWKLLLEMKNYGIQPDVVSFTIVINSLCKMSYLNEATALLFKMTQLGISPDPVLLSSIIDGHCKLGQTEVAISILKIFNTPLNIFIYNSFISKLCTDGNMVEASSLFHEMSMLGLLPDCICYSTIIDGYCKVRDIDRAFQYFGKMLKNGITPCVTTYTSLIDAYCKSGNMEMAEYLLQKMISEGLAPDIVTFNTLMDGFGRKGHLQKVFGLLDMMNSSNVSPDIVTYNTLIHSLVTRGFVIEAKEILFELIKRGFSLDVVTFTNLIDGFSKKGNFEEAFFVWFYMSEHDVKPDVVTCSALLNGYCRERRIEEANVLFHKMLNIGLRPDLILYNTLIHGHCSFGSMDDACTLISMMIEHGIFPNYITHQALVLGFRKKRVMNPVENANLKLQQILLKYGIQVDVDEYLREQPGSCKQLPA
ncbi:hypothetical protein CerSpe_069050 [Prunus speciosa]